jgi:hypothetical protein
MDKLLTEGVGVMLELTATPMDASQTQIKIKVSV